MKIPRKIYGVKPQRADGWFFVFFEGPKISINGKSWAARHRPEMRQYEKNNSAQVVSVRAKDELEAYTLTLKALDAAAEKITARKQKNETL